MFKKLLLSLLVLILMTSAAYSGSTASVTIQDDNGNFIGIAPKGLATVLKDVAIADGNGNYYRSIKVTADVLVYYAPATTVTATVSAATTILVHPNLRLKVDTLCFIY